MNNEEVKVLEKTFGRVTPEWKKAFADYNRESGQKMLSMACRSCWMKVLQWHKSKIE
jgi:hypothetical protein